MAHDVRPARDLRSFDATPHLLRRVTSDRARQTTVSRVQGEHLERAETRKVEDCEISVLFDFTYGYRRKIQTCWMSVVPGPSSHERATRQRTRDSYVYRYTFQRPADHFDWIGWAPFVSSSHLWSPPRDAATHTHGGRRDASRKRSNSKHPHMYR